jgi:copper chaperone
MPDLQVNGMTCGHCEKAVTRAVHSVDPAAEVNVERASGRVSVESHADAAVLKQAIEAEGYSVEAARG